MEALENRLSAFSCSVHDEKSQATIVCGARSFPARVIAVSRDAFEIVVPQDIAKRFKIDRKYQLQYDGEVWLVACSLIDTSPGHRHQITLDRAKDLTKMTAESFSLKPGDKGFSVRQSDPVLSVGVALTILLIVLITPGWGDQLGTSDALTDAISSALQAISEMFGSLTGSN